MEFSRISSLTIFPADSLTLSLFIIHLHQRNYAPNTIRTFVSAVAYYHKLHQYSDPSDSFIVSKTLKGLYKLRPSVDVRQPITRSMLHQLYDILPQVSANGYDTILFRAMFLFAFYALARISEITECRSTHNIIYSDLQVLSKPSRIIVTFRTFKHSVVKQSVSIYCHHPHQFCPVHNMLGYLGVRPNANHLFVTCKGTPVPRLLFTYILKQCILHARLDPKLYTSHSFRIGGATYSAEKGLSALAIQRLGRWRSNAFMKYLRW